MNASVRYFPKRYKVKKCEILVGVVQGEKVCGTCRSGTKKKMKVTCQRVKRK